MLRGGLGLTSSLQSHMVVDLMAVKAQMVLVVSLSVPLRVTVAGSGRISSLVVVFVPVHSLIFQLHHLELLPAMQSFPSHFQSVS